ncbi:hypothetical protein HDU83_008302 [Entophlyctis luteolus]|nr:hypothetical protein HDU83_008302 [Entophlyctis luteolus]
MSHVRRKPPLLPSRFGPTASLGISPRRLRCLAAAALAAFAIASLWIWLFARRPGTALRVVEGPHNEPPPPLQPYARPRPRLRIPHPRLGTLQSTADLPPSQFSRFTCAGDDNSVQAFRERVCVFNNVCYDATSDKFTFHAKKVRDPANPSETKFPTVLFDSSRGERVTFNEDGHGFVALWQTTDIFGADMSNTWGPEVTQDPLPSFTNPKQTVTLHNLHAVWSLWAYDDNLGHVLWEEMAGLFFAMSRMDVLTDDLIAMHYPSSLPERKLSKKFRDAFFPAISSQSPVNLKDYIADILKQHAKQSPAAAAATNVCFDQLLVGGNMRRFLHSVAWHNQGHEQMFKQLRDRILVHHGLNPRQVPRAHHIVVTNKTETNFRADDTVGARKRAIANLDEVVEFLREKYAKTVKVTSVEWHTLTVPQQLELMFSATVFVTPPGGVSMLLPFLPEGAHAIIMDYLENEVNNWYGTQVGDSISMEAPFWNHWPHVRKLYYQIRGVQDMVSDSASKGIDQVSWREGVSYVLDVARLEALVEQAFDAMEA